MKRKRKRINKILKLHRKSKFDFLSRIFRVFRWLLPGLLIKRWMFTSAIGLIISILGLAIWTNLQPLYWLIEIFFAKLTSRFFVNPIEKHFGFLWQGNPEDLTDEQKMMYDLYQKTRQEILDKGNAQAKNIDAELAQYDIKWLRYSTVIPVKKEEKE